MTLIQQELRRIVFNKMKRRDFLLAAAANALLPMSALANNADINKISWQDFKLNMHDLANVNNKQNISQAQLVKRGFQILKRLDLNSGSFKHALQNAYESGNHFWLWQRLIKDKNINGGVLNIDDNQIVQLHDHPGATGMIRIISGEVETWQFDQACTKNKSPGNICELKRVSHRILRANDMAVLTPENGNIHALRSISKTARMLDIFIPPYDTKQRNWYQPQLENWFDKEIILCEKIPQDKFNLI